MANRLQPVSLHQDRWTPKLQRLLAQCTAECSSPSCDPCPCPLLMRAWSIPFALLHFRARRKLPQPDRAGARGSSAGWSASGSHRSHGVSFQSCQRAMAATKHELTRKLFNREPGSAVPCHLGGGHRSTVERQLPHRRRGSERTCGRRRSSPCLPAGDARPEWLQMPRRRSAQ